MGRITKEQYDRRNENAAIRMQKNAEISTMTNEQHEAISILCTARHELHCNMKQAITTNDNNFKKAIILANVAIFESGIEFMNFVGIDNSDYIDIDSIDELNEDVPELGSKEYDEWYNKNYTRISSELEELNFKIETYLSEIDKKYNTNYYPSGMLRK